ncbi:hypothetical protein NI456_11195 [Brevundimonas diminuta]|uniref:ABC-three component system protein n=1 Tax=Brevundimonas diminuta TaxID=293 RepID=UPI0020976FF5|nr:ABC-three component system protein [Brevundimonas diminuta]MCO8019422.1 hypothetical protein [Brevundimonas diminuta]MCO8022100.1 hypothetical protein [Brevundimonas diminuta]
MTFSLSRRNAIKAALELKLRRAKGVKLQEFLTELMTQVHGDGFQGTSTDYSRGDLQCDGLLSDPLTVFACYGPVNAGANSTAAAMSTAVDKVETDFTGALKNWPAMKAWKFVHNYVEQPPAQIVAKIMELRTAHPNVQIDIFGKEQFEAALFGLDADAIDDLVGQAASEEDFRAIQPQVLLKVVGDLMAVDHNAAMVDPPREVPERKLHFNGLSHQAQSRIVQGMQNSNWVQQLLANHQDPMLDTQVAAVLKAKYLDLKAQDFTPDDILFQLYDFVAAVERVSAALDVAVWSLLAHFFEVCTIFEDEPVEASAA